MRKPKPSPKRLPPEAYRLPDWTLFDRPFMERSGGSVDYEERHRRYTEADKAYQREFSRALREREVYAALVPAPRGRPPIAIREAVVAEFERRCRTGELRSPKDLLGWIVEQKNFGHKALPSERTVLRWITRKRT